MLNEWKITLSTYLSLDNSNTLAQAMQISDSSKAWRACGSVRGWDTEARTDTVL